MKSFAITLTFLGLFLHTCTWIVTVTCSSIGAADDVGAAVDLEAHNDGDNLPNNLQPFLPDENDAGGYIRALLCPNVPLEALPYFRFHLITRTCWEVGTQGPCGQNMVFVKELATKAIGKCICMVAQNGDGVSYRPLLRDPATNQCYYMFSQAFCPDGHWLTVNPQNHNHVQCEPNPCASSVSANAFTTTTTNSASSSTTFNSSTLDETILEVEEEEEDLNNETSTTATARMYEEDEVLEPQQGQQQQNDVDDAEYLLFNGTCIKLDSYSEFCSVPNQILSFMPGGVLGCTEPRLHFQLQQNNGDDEENDNTINQAVAVAVGVISDDEQQEEAENLIHRRR